MERLTAKILDNLRISILDIHIRFELDSDSRRFSAGLTLEGI